ncbi:hypothetical protein [Staphylococcus kloosii]|jgi:hypothetical protein|uniref:hypothetical protein n=1 Tax=Staphylococcus TaxID=1279 RepID=UPI00085C85A2|nr:hypothetical protein [Staphylococcus kloosii]MBF7023339.1 hypothetical protein [Staphylococcus kloosii]SCT46850.1 Uncharacterised protein [Staphylococcus cohnii subsp. cohnii]
MAKSQIAKWEKRLRYSMVTIFLLLTVLNGVFSDFDNMKHFYFSNNTILLTFCLLISGCELMRFFSKNSNQYMRIIMLIAHSFVYLNIILLILILTFHLYKIFGYFGVIFLFCFINFLSLNITEWIIKKKMILHKKVDKYGEA